MMSSNETITAYSRVGAAIACGDAEN